MKFSTWIYTDFKKDTSLLEMGAYILNGLGLLIFIASFIFSDAVDAKVMIFAIICFGIAIIIQFAGFGIVESHSKTPIGTIEFSIEFLSWNDMDILWKEIEKIKLSYFDYKKKLINTGDGNYKHKRSSGLDNTIAITLKDGTILTGNILISSKGNQRFLKEVLLEIVKANSISLENAKNMVHPSNYKEHQELKKYCK